MKKPRKKYPSNEAFYLNKDGTRGDALIHEEMLSSPEGNEAARKAAIEAAMDAGMDLETATKYFGGTISS